MEKKTQIGDILRYLKDNKKGLTQMQATNMFGATRLSGVIFTLRKRGYDIETIDEVKKTRYGNSMTIARYVLHEG